MKNQKGFSLVGLMVLIVFIAVVAFVFMLSYSEASAKAEAKKTLLAIQKAENYLLKERGYFVDNPYMLVVLDSLPGSPLCRYEFKKTSDSTFMVTATSRKFTGFFQIKESGEPQFFYK